MSERKLADAIGIDQSAVDGLARAGVRTIEDLAEADPDAIATASGIPLERIRDWQGKARRAAAPARPNPVAKGWMVGTIGVIIAILLGALLIKIGSYKIEQADKVRLASEGKLQVATSFVAGEAMDRLREGRLALRGNNWGSAQQSLSDVDARITLLEQIAPDSEKASVADLRSLMSDVQNAVTQQSSDASDKLDALEAALNKVRQK